MAHTVIPNPFTPGVESSLDVLPLKANGAQWRHCTIFNNHESVVLSDDLAGIISAHVDEYEQADFDRKEVIREYLAELVCNVNNRSLAENSTLTNEERAEALKSIPFNDYEGDMAPRWTNEVPLAVNVGHYAPHSDVKLPQGNVIQVDSLTEDRLVKAMEKARIIFHFER